MTGGLLPPFGEPLGERVDDAAVLAAFARGEPAGHSGTFHVERENTLLVEGDMAVAVRVAPATVLLRVDLPDRYETVRRSIEQALEAEGMRLLDRETLLAAPVAMQVLGLRVSTWDLWGKDIDESFTVLRAAAVGHLEEFFPEGPPSVGPAD